MIVNDCVQKLWAAGHTQDTVGSDGTVVTAYSIVFQSCFSQSANHMNSSLLSLYRKGNPGSGSNVPEMEQRERTASTPRITSKGDSIPLKIPARESEGRWFIGKIQGGKKERFFLDVSNKKNIHNKPLSEIQVSI